MITIIGHGIERFYSGGEDFCHKQRRVDPEEVHNHLCLKGEPRIQYLFPVVPVVEIWHQRWKEYTAECRYEAQLSALKSTIDKVLGWLALSPFGWYPVQLLCM